VKLEDFAEEEKRKGWINHKGMKVFSLYDSRNPFFIIFFLILRKARQKQNWDLFLSKRIVQLKRVDERGFHGF
jgi:hypothetical protein